MEIREIHLETRPFNFIELQAKESPPEVAQFHNVLAQSMITPELEAQLKKAKENNDRVLKRECKKRFGKAFNYAGTFEDKRGSLVTSSAICVRTLPKHEHLWLQVVTHLKSSRDKIKGVLNRCF